MATRSEGGAPPRLLFVSNLFPDQAEPYRGLDNATVLHHLRDDFEIRALSPRPALGVAPWAGRERTARRAREIDAPFAPRYLEVPYIPKVGSRWNHRLMARALRPVLRQLREEFAFDVVLCSWLYPDGCAAVPLCAELDLPCVLISQGTDAHQYLKNPVRRRLIVGACGGSDGVVTRSKELARLLGEAGVAAGKLHPIYNGVDTEVFRPRDKEELRAQLGAGVRGGPLLLFVGNLLPIKDPGALLEAFARLLQRGAGDAELVMVGKGPLRPELERQCGQLGIADRVTFTGPLDAAEVARWMAAADVLCMSSINEGLPNVVLEALSSGLPIVATDVGGIAEVVDRPERGAVVPRGDREAYCSALQQLLSRQNPQSAPLKRFDWASAASAYRELLLAAIQARSDSR